jgi:hypothetical protein
MTELILDKEEIEKMGLHGEELYVIEYDLNSKIKIPKNATEQEKKEIKERNKYAEQIRNKLFFTLKFKIKATRHLESSWLIAKDRLETAKVLLEEIKSDLKSKNFDNVDRRIRIIPILTTEEGFQDYETQKIEFLLQFCMEHIAYCDNALTEKRMSKSNLWRCKKAYEIVNELAQELKSQDAQQEIQDTAEILSDKISQVEAMILQQQEQKEKETKT